MAEYNFNEIWPISISDLTQEQILGLSDIEFEKLVRALRERAEQSGHTKRAAREAVRRLKNLRSKQYRLQAAAIEISLLDRKFSESPLLSSFMPEREIKWINPEKRKVIRSIDAEKFSIVDNPKRTFETLSELVRLEGIARSAKLNFKDTYVLDVSPFPLFGMLSERMAPYLGNV